MTLLFALLALLLAATLCVVFASGMKHDRRQAALGALFVALLSAALYVALGSPRIVEPAAEHNKRANMLAQKITESSEAIKKNPNDLEAWLTMAQAFSDSGDYKAAANGFKQAVLISKGEPRIIMAYAESLVLEQGGVVTPQAKKSIDIALMIDPKLPLARYYQAIWLLQEERQEEAMAMMKELYAELPDDSKLKKRMKTDIGRK